MRDKQWRRQHGMRHQDFHAPNWFPQRWSNPMRNFCAVTLTTTLASSFSIAAWGEQPNPKQAQYRTIPSGAAKTINPLAGASTAAAPPAAAGGAKANQQVNQFNSLTPQLGKPQGKPAANSFPTTPSTKSPTSLPPGTKPPTDFDAATTIKHPNYGSS